MIIYRVPMTLGQALVRAANATVGVALLMPGLYYAVKHRRHIAVLDEQDERLLVDIGLTRDDLRDALRQLIWHDPTVLLARVPLRPGQNAGQPRGAANCSATARSGRARSTARRSPRREHASASAARLRRARRTPPAGCAEIRSAARRSRASAARPPSWWNTPAGPPAAAGPRSIVAIA